MTSKFKALLIAVGVLLVLCLVAWIQHRKITSQKAEIERLQHNVSVLVSDAKVRYVRDSLRAVEVGTLVMDMQDLRDKQVNDARLIKDLEIKLRDARQVQTVTTVYRDTVTMVLRDTVRASGCLSYSDDWANIAFCPDDSTLSYEWRDSVTTVLHVSYKRRFLWWRWRPEYKTTAVSHNPQCTRIGIVNTLIEQ